MRKGMKYPILVEVILALLVLGLLCGAMVFNRTMKYGFSTHDEPTAMEAFMARRMRNWSAPADLRNMKNPLPMTAEVLEQARSHWADHCATCHGNDGKGSAMGLKLYPRAPDMTLEPTRRLSDGEIFATIENGIRLTGMPAFGEGTAESAYGTWTLVHFVRHLPEITPEELEEMKSMNPVSPMEMQEMKSEENFLEGGDDKPAEAAEHAGHSH